MSLHTETFSTGHQSKILKNYIARLGCYSQIRSTINISLCAWQAGKRVVEKYASSGAVNKHLSISFIKPSTEGGPRPCGRAARAAAGNSNWKGPNYPCAAQYSADGPLSRSAWYLFWPSPPVPTSKTKKNSIVVLHYHFFVRLQCGRRTARLQCAAHNNPYMSVAYEWGQILS